MLEVAENQSRLYAFAVNNGQQDGLKISSLLN